MTVDGALVRETDPIEGTLHDWHIFNKGFLTTHYGEVLSFESMAQADGSDLATRLLNAKRRLCLSAKSIIAAMMGCLFLRLRGKGFLNLPPIHFAFFGDEDQFGAACVGLNQRVTLADQLQPMCAGMAFGAHQRQRVQQGGQLFQIQWRIWR